MAIPRSKPSDFVKSSARDEIDKHKKNIPFVMRCIGGETMYLEVNCILVPETIPDECKA